MSTAGPRTSMPLAISAARSAVTKNCVGLATDTASVDGFDPSAIEPRTVSVVLPIRRCASIDVDVPAGAVVTALATVRPLVPTDRLIAAASPAAGPGDTLTRSAFSL